ncbi:MAG: ABC transporter permease [Polyangiales bacterium]
MVICLSLPVIGALFFSNFWTINRASLGSLFNYLGWALVVLIVPALTMRLLAEEKRTGTIELLITMPVRDAEVVLGKFFASLGLIFVLLLLTAIYPLMIGRLGDLDVGPMWVGYLGLLLLAAAGLAVGLFYSSITDNQIVAFMLTGVTLFVLWVLEYIGQAAGGSIGDVLNFVSFMRRISPFTRGLLDIRNVVYFVSVAAFFLLLTIRSLESRKWK